MATIPRIPDYGFAKQHDPRTVRMYRVIEAMDFGNGDGLMLSSGGDGDNGEMLMDCMDQYWKILDDALKEEYRKILDAEPKSRYGYKECNKCPEGWVNPDCEQHGLGVPKVSDTSWCRTEKKFPDAGKM